MRRAAAVLAIVLAACGGRPARISLPAGSRVLARGSLAYAVAFAAGDRIVSIELEERFALVVRSPDGHLLGRHDLGPAERDLAALAIAGDVAWVGGADRRVRGLALTDGHPVADWPTGAGVSALAALPGDRLAIGDGEGGLCLRRLADGALLQCVQLADHAIDALTVAGDVLMATAGDRRWGLTVPALAPAPAAADLHRFALAGRALWIDGAAVVRLGGAVRAVAVDDRGRIAVAGWIARLDDPSLVLLQPR